MSCALGLASLGESYARRAMRWWGGLEMADRALPLAEQALAREPGLLEAQLVQAMAHRLRGEVPQLLEMLDRLAATLDTLNGLTSVGLPNLTTLSLEFYVGYCAGTTSPHGTPTVLAPVLTSPPAAERVPP